jgi:cholesterol transport system auxiliary component
MLEGKSALWRLAPVSLVALAVTGCSLLPWPAASPPNLFVLASQREGTPPLDVPARGIDIAPPAARPGFDGPRMAYVTRPYEIQFFTRHQWLEAPARMLAPLLVEALEAGGRFHARPGGRNPPPVLRLETEIVALQQEFTVRPSQVRFTLRARLLDALGRRVLATSHFEDLEDSPSDDPYGGVIAANRAVARVLDRLADWCAEKGSEAATATE